MKKRVYTLAASILLPFLLLTGCASNGAAPADKQTERTPAASGQQAGQASDVLSLKMGLQPWLGNGPWWIAEKKGMFEKHGLKVELVSFVQDADMNAAFLSDNVQAANLATHTTIRMVAKNNLDVKGIIYMDESQDADAILASKDIAGVEQLKGKKVAFEEGTTSDLLLQQALKEKGMKKQDVETVFMPAANAGLSLIPGQVDAAVTYAPFIHEVLDKGKDKGLHVVYSGKNAPGLISDIVVLKSEYLSQHPDAKEKLRQVWDEALEYWKANEQEGNEIVAAGSGSKPEELPPILEGLKFYSTKETADLAASGKLAETVKNIHSLMVESEGLKADIDLDHMLDMQ
ncbi:ABC transporter substrate-binding protein [Brevibacillus massiliensis]|uniref:ABC transporter substrate-binding protein n=1 Tax=Brevibacillus massiliensis TaxID=1118054 RepID=UPI0002F15B66|nr:ABC transporter substrate-binding protein [Brevibacillus massiliensis]